MGLNANEYQGATGKPIAAALKERDQRFSQPRH
jgi:hypothetical protein